MLSSFVSKTRLQIEEKRISGGGSEDKMNSNLFSKRVDSLPQQGAQDGRTDAGSFL